MLVSVRPASWGAAGDERRAGPSTSTTCSRPTCDGLVTRAGSLVTGAGWIAGHSGRFERRYLPCWPCIRVAAYHPLKSGKRRHGRPGPAARCGFKVYLESCVCKDGCRSLSIKKTIYLSQFARDGVDLLAGALGSAGAVGGYDLLPRRSLSRSLSLSPRPPSILTPSRLFLRRTSPFPPPFRSLPLRLSAPSWTTRCSAPVVCVCVCVCVRACVRACE